MSVSRPYPGLVERQTADVFRWRHWHHHHRIHAWRGPGGPAAAV